MSYREMTVMSIYGSRNNMLQECVVDGGYGNLLVTWNCLYSGGRRKKQACSRQNSEDALIGAVSAYAAGLVAVGAYIYLFHQEKMLWAVELMEEREIYDTLLSHLLLLSGFCIVLS